MCHCSLYITDTTLATTVVKVTISDVNDNSPVFDREIYNVILVAPAVVDQSASTGSRWVDIGVVKATDRDGGVCGHVVYVIVAGNEHGLFRVDQHSGTRTNPCTIQGLVHEMSKQQFLLFNSLQ